MFYDIITKTISTYALFVYTYIVPRVILPTKVIGFSADWLDMQKIKTRASIH